MLALEAVTKAVASKIGVLRLISSVFSVFRGRRISELAWVIGWLVVWLFGWLFGWCLVGCHLN